MPKASPDERVFWKRSSTWVLGRHEVSTVDDKEMESDDEDSICDGGGGRLTGLRRDLLVQCVGCVEGMIQITSFLCLMIYLLARATADYRRRFIARPDSSNREDHVIARLGMAPHIFSEGT